MGKFSKLYLKEAMVFTPPGGKPPKVPVTDANTAGDLVKPHDEKGSHAPGKIEPKDHQGTEANVKGDLVKPYDEKGSHAPGKKEPNENRKTYSESELKSLIENVQEYKAHTTPNGKPYHMSKSNSDAVKNLKDGKSTSVEVVHHHQGALRLSNLNAHRIGNHVHLHETNGDYVDTLKHPDAD